MKLFYKYLAVSVASFFAGSVFVYILFAAYIKTLDVNFYSRELEALSGLIVQSSAGYQCVPFDFVFNRYEEAALNGPRSTPVGLLDVFFGAYVGGGVFMERGDYQERLRILKNMVAREG